MTNIISQLNIDELNTIVHNAVSHSKTFGGRIWSYTPQDKNNNPLYDKLANQQFKLNDIIQATCDFINTAQASNNLPKIQSLHGKIKELAANPLPQMNFIQKILTIFKQKIGNWIEKREEKLSYIEREMAKIQVANDGKTLKDLPAYQNDKDIVFKAINQNLDAAEFADKKLMADSSFIMQIGYNQPEILKYASLELRNNNTFMEEFIQTHKNVDDLLAHAGDKLKNNFEFMHKMVKLDGHNIQHVGDNLKQDLILAKAAFQQTSEAFDFFHPDLQKNLEIQNMVKTHWTAVIEKDPSQYDQLPDFLKKDRDVAMCAAKRDCGILDSIPDELKTQEFMLEIIAINPIAMDYLPDSLEKPEFMLEAVKKNGLALEGVPTKFWNINLHLAAVTQTHKAWEFLPESFKKLEPFMLKAMASNPDTLRHVTPEIKSNEKHMLPLLKKSPAHFELIGEDLKNSDKFMRDAILEIPELLQYVPEKYRNDPELLKAVIQKSPEAIKFLGETLKGNLSFLQELLKLHDDIDFFTALRKIHALGTWDTLKLEQDIEEKRFSKLNSILQEAANEKPSMDGTWRYYSSIDDIK